MGTGVRVRGMGTRWVGGGYTGYPAMLLEEGPRDSGAGPGRPAGAGVGGPWEPDALCALCRHPPCGPGRSHAGPSLVPAPLRTRLLTNKGEISVISLRY